MSLSENRYVSCSTRMQDRLVWYGPQADIPWKMRSNGSPPSTEGVVLSMGVFAGREGCSLADSGCSAAALLTAVSMPRSFGEAHKQREKNRASVSSSAYFRAWMTVHTCKVWTVWHPPAAGPRLPGVG